MGRGTVTVGIGGVDALAAGFQRDHDHGFACPLHAGNQRGEALLELCGVVGGALALYGG